MARCLVTGHRGYIGSNLFATLQSAGHDVLGIDLADVVSHDVAADLKEDNDGHFHPLYLGFKPEYIFHLACWPRVGYSIENPVSTMQNNVLQTSHLLNYARKTGVKRVIYSGSSAVVGNGYGPESPYALQKLISEMECKLYSDLYNLDTVTLRYFNVYSRCQKADGPYATAISNWMHAIREKINPFITGTGEQKRDMAHLTDVIAANLFAMNYKQNFNGTHFDVGTGENISLNEIREIVLKHNPEIKFDYVEERPNDVMATRANIEPLKKIGWTPTINIKKGVEKCFVKEEKI